jgi:hypothetical protein
MSLKHGFQFALHRRSAFGGRCGAILGIFLLLMQLFSPLVAQASNGGVWMTICSEFGAVEVLIESDASEDKNTPDCPDCPVCALCALTHAIAPDQKTEFDLFGAIALRMTPNTPDPVVKNSAQFWPDSRGPPIGKADAAYHPSCAPMVTSTQQEGAAT